MAISPGDRLGPYEIVGALGAGGMGEVYRARDTKLNRDVAIKVLPESFAVDPDRLARFRREAQVLASLNHSNIGGIYGLEESNGVTALVLELVDGPTLAEYIAHGRIPLDEALPIARQIAAGLDAAHEHGIIHRDIKPANIKLRPDGSVKILDFGLAKAVSDESLLASSPPLTNSPTITRPVGATGVGIPLGTAAYMSPEQARGKAVDKRADIWAFGCVLFEMLTGRRAFEGEDATDTLGAVVHGDLEWSALPPDVPEAIRRLLRRCLEKEPKERLRDIGDARLDLAKPDPSERMAVAPKSNRRAWMAVAALSLALVAALIPAVLDFGPVPAPTRDVQFEVPVPPGTAPRVAISPDGRRVVYVAPAGGSGRLALWVRPLNALNAEMLPGTDGAIWPFWSPDSQSIAFFADGKLKKVAAAGGHAQAFAGVDTSGRGGTWNRHGIIVFTSTVLRSIAESGGDVIDLTTLDKSLEETFHAWPSFLPDGRHFLYLAWSNKAENRAIYVGSLDSKTRTRLMAADSMAIYAVPGFVLFGGEGGLMARPFDSDRLAFTGDAVPVAEEFRSDPFGRGRFDASDDGTLIYRAGAGSSVNRELVWVDRTGKRSAPIGAPIRALTLKLSPDGKRVAFSETSGASGAEDDLWIYDIDRDFRVRLTTGASIDHMPVWSPDGSQLVFDSHRGKDRSALYTKPAHGAMPERLLLEPEPGTPGLGALDWSRDGQLIVLSVWTTALNNDLWVLPLTGDRKPVPYLTTPFDESEASLSPNGRWLAYTSNESGSYQVIVRSFPDPSRDRRQISTQGGAHPRWRRDGREIYYLDPAGRIVAVEVTADQNLEIGKSTPLFDSSLAFPVRPAGPAYRYDVTPDGQQFLISALPGNTPPPIIVVLNWQEELKQRVPTQ